MAASTRLSSALGHFRKSAFVVARSALLPATDIVSPASHVRKVPMGDIARDPMGGSHFGEGQHMRRFRVTVKSDNRRLPNVVAYCDRFDCFDTAFHGDGSGARQIGQSLVLGCIFNRTIGPARAPFSWRRKSAN